MAQAAIVAQQRNSSQRDAGRKDGLVKGNSLNRDLEGALAELAVSKAFNLPWTGRFYPIQTWDKWKHEGNDVGKLEIRSTDRSNGRLICHPNDKDDSPYLLVLSHDSPFFHLVGWVFGKDAKNSLYWRTNVPKPCYMVPQENLKSISSLIEKFVGVHNEN